MHPHLQPKQLHVLEALQKAGVDGVEESVLFNDLETSNNVNVIKCKLNKMLGRNSIIVKMGVWYLHENYWRMTRMEFTDIMNQHERREARNHLYYTAVAIVAIMSSFLPLVYIAGFSHGGANSFEIAAEILNAGDYQIIIEDE